MPFPMRRDQHAVNSADAASLFYLVHLSFLALTRGSADRFTSL